MDAALVGLVTGAAFGLVGLWWASLVRPGAVVALFGDGFERARDATRSAQAALALAVLLATFVAGFVTAFLSATRAP
jgi:hypothetical protein